MSNERFSSMLVMAVTRIKSVSGNQQVSRQRSRRSNTIITYGYYGVVISPLPPDRTGSVIVSVIQRQQRNAKANSMFVCRINNALITDRSETSRRPLSDILTSLLVSSRWADAHKFSPVATVTNRARFPAAVAYSLFSERRVQGFLKTLQSIIAVHGITISRLRSVTCHGVTKPPDTCEYCERAPRQPQPDKSKHVYLPRKDRRLS